MVDLNELARNKDLFIDNAATASQNETLIDDGVTREAIELNIITPLIVEISERDQRIAALEAQNKLWQRNMREAYESFSAMRNDLNELFPMQSAEADLSDGPEWSVACAAIVDAARDRFAALEAQLAERVVELREARRVISGTHKRAVKHDNCEKPYCPICEGGLFVCADCGAAEIETEQRLCTGPALEAAPPAPKVTECATEGCAQTATVRFERGGVGSDYCHDCYMRIQALTAALEVDSFDG